MGTVVARLKDMTKILFVEDEPALQKVLGEFLRKEGFEVISALDGEQGLSLASREHPDLILLDLILPRVNGIAFLEQMKGKPEIASIPVIVLTNVESSDAVEQAVALGAKAYLVKANYRLDEVISKVRAVLSEKS